MTDSVHRGLLRSIADALGGAVPPEWREAIRTVPRHRFLPERIWLEDGEGGYAACELRQDPDRWFTAAYSDVPVVTQVNDGEEPDDPDDLWPSSSASAPSIVVRMLRDLDVRPGMNVLEIGTGTGWNAALLAHRLGAGQVASVEVDQEVARQACASLNAAGLSVDVLCGDGARGWRLRQPFDRIVSTCSVRRVPTAWVEQTSPGGLILTPWDNPMLCWGLLKLTVGDGQACGRFSPHSAFMLMRGQRRDLRIFRDVVRDDHVPDESRASLAPNCMDDWEARFALGLKLGDVWTAWDHTRLWVATTDALSWAAVDPYEVWQYGPRRLWDEVEAAYRWWEQHGRPGPERFGLTVNGPDQWVWLDRPTDLIRALP
ncbi:methyltransferase domain-containing protein [Kitasatospora sp. NPDC093558]|uniref:methyltransferase domain-containing protein n=1 Tax=Kitasatospora sp. NPDC093558 TaxID=3155201 RepID=UPI00341405EF